ncbi:MAG: LPS export ABC transporter periplasmic protein LptC [Bacteroidetes bacterium]|jgi:LPS export ABC transporter protein LptC|nr:LPS export ABC transporter periplasmic protein LptC [Bacteroidota bacterium]
MACENDIETIRSLTSKVDYPDLSGKDVKVIYTDSTKKKLEIKAPTVLRFTTVEEPYTEFPDGIEVKFYDDNEQLESQINADKATYFQDQQLWEARDNVFARNFITGEKLTTDQLFWDEEEGTVYSNQFSKIETEDGIFYGEEGFEADQGLEKWILKSSQGTVNVNEQESDETE